MSSNSNPNRINAGNTDSFCLEIALLKLQRPGNTALQRIFPFDSQSLTKISIASSLCLSTSKAIGNQTDLSLSCIDLKLRLKAQDQNLKTENFATNVLTQAYQMVKWYRSKACLIWPDCPFNMEAQHTVQVHPWNNPWYWLRPLSTRQVTHFVMCEIFDLLHSRDFYAMKPPWVGKIIIFCFVHVFEVCYSKILYQCLLSKR